jgi:two-component system chemotaxis sensor kinase CheA
MQRSRPSPKLEEMSATPPRRGLSIFQQLLLLTLSLVAVSATLPAAFLVTRQMDRMSAALETKALAYTQLVSDQVKSAIAFADRETAREVFDSVSEDPDVDGLTLLTSTGQVLFARGVTGDLQTPGVPKDDAELVSLPDGIQVRHPVVSLEGPRGTLIVRISKRRLRESRRAVERQAVGTGVLALLFGALAAYRIARSLSVRLEAIARVAQAVAQGELEQPALGARGQDEIAVVAQAFDAMLLQLRELIAHIKHQAEREQRQLEELVAQRTRELSARNLDLRRVLDHVGQGFLTLDREGVMSRERSAILERWLGPASATEHFHAYLGRSDAKVGAWFELNWQAITDDCLPIELALDQLPKQILVGSRRLEIDYRAILNEKAELERVLVVLSDGTAELERARAEADERELTRLATRLLADRAGFREFSEEVQALTEKIRAGGQLSELQLWLHTLKGNAAILGVDSLSTLCHELENELAERASLDPPSTERLVRRRAELWAKLEPLIDSQRGRIELEISAYEELLGALDARAPYTELERRVRAWRLEPTQTAFERLGEHAERLAERLGKGPIDVHIESNQLRLDPTEWQQFWSAAVHLVRNCIDHGLETAEERRANGKPVPARVELRSVLADGYLQIEIADDGRGVDWAAISARAHDRELRTSTPAELTDALFEPGVSTRASVSELSGRGVGLSVVKHACDELGGSVEVESSTNSGTRFRFAWPASRFGLSPALPPQPQVSALRWAAPPSGSPLPAANLTSRKTRPS